jgi:hypothetical protein
MFKVFLCFGASLVGSGLALACPTSDDCDCEEHVTNKANAAECAQNAELLGSACSYSTKMMAERVLAEGRHYSYIGSLHEASNELVSHVAAPFTVGPKNDINVVANEVVEELSRVGAEKKRLDMSGKLLEVEGVLYYILTEYVVLPLPRSNSM